MHVERNHRRSLRLALLQPKLFVWAVYIFLIPIYIFKSGLPQPGDFFILLLVPVALYGWNGRLSKDARTTIRPLLWFTVWVCIVDYTWALALGNFGLFGRDTFILFPVYYIYNALIFLVSLVLFRRYGDVFLRVTVTVLLATVVLQVVMSFAVGSAAFRGSLFFNNPNQLGYFALLAATIVAVAHRRLQYRVWMTSAAITCCAYLALVSASRASVVGIAIIVVFLVFSNPRVIVLACLAAVALGAVSGPVTDAFESSKRRMTAERNTKLNFFEERGYDRIWNHKEYVILGAGEGGLSRFASTAHVKEMEIHSSFGMILFSYGIVGSVLFIMFMIRLVRGAATRSALMLLPPMLYTIAHQGLRFTLLWVLLAIFLALKEPAPQTPRSATT